MTPADPPDETPDAAGGAGAGAGADDAPITPEVVDGGGASRRGAAARKRRSGVGGPPDAGGADIDAPVPGARPVRPASGRWFRAGCLVLVGLGIIELFFSAQLVLDPEGARCTAARFEIDEANDDDEDFNDVDLPEGADDADDVDDCDEAIALASGIPEDEDEPADGEFTEASTFRSQGIIISVLGLGHALSGFLTLRTRARRMRTVALVFTALGLFLPILGLYSMLAMAFIVFALVFSNDAKAIFGPAGGGGFLRPRPPRTNPS